MIRCAITSPMPRSGSSCSFVAVLRLMHGGCNSDCEFEFFSARLLVETTVSDLVRSTLCSQDATASRNVRMINLITPQTALFRIHHRGGRCAARGAQKRDVFALTQVFRAPHARFHIPRW